MKPTTALILPLISLLIFTCAQILIFQNQMWLLGKDGTWTTNDGKTFRRTAAGRPFSDRRAYGSVVYDGQMCIYGGIGAEKTAN